MKRFKNILMLYAQRIGDEAALARATSLARSNRARLTVVEVHGAAPMPAAAFVRERTAHLERLTASIRHEDVDVAVKVLLGRDFLEIIRLVLADRHDLVIMTADSVEGLRSLTFGTLSMHLMRKCPCPVWVMKPSAAGRFRKVLAAIAPRPDAPVNPLDVKIVELASSLVRVERGHLDIVHAWDYTGADLETSRSELTESIRADLFQRHETLRRAAVQGVLEKVDLSGVAYDVHVVRGHPEIVVPELAHGHQVDLVVMGTVTVGGIAGFLIGTSAEHMLRMVDCSVLTIKPDDFITPVTLQG